MTDKLTNGLTNGLTGRELDVLRLVAQGLTTREVAEHLSLAPKTVEHMLGNEDPTRAIYPKIGVTNRSSAAAWYVAKYGRPNGEPTSPDMMEQLFELAFDYVARIYQMRLFGNAGMAREMGAFLVNMLETNLTSTQHRPSREALLRVQARTLLELGMIQLETSLRGEVFPLTVPIYARICKIGRELRDRETMGSARMLIAGAYHIIRKFPASEFHYARAYSLLSSADYRLRCLRGMALCAAYMGNSELVADHAARARMAIDAGDWNSPEYVAATLEGVGRAQGIVGSAVSFQWFDEAERLIAPTGPEEGLAQRQPLRMIQLSLSRFEVLKRTEPRSLMTLERLGQTSIEMAQDYGYPRHKLWMESLLAELLG